MSPFSYEDFDPRRSERRGGSVEHLAYAEKSPGEQRNYFDRRADPYWRHSWLRARVSQSLRD